MVCADRRAALSLDDSQSIHQSIRPRIAQRLPFGLGFGFAVFAAFLKSCADGASLLLGLRGFLPAARRLRMFSYRPGLAMGVQQLHQSDDHNKAPALGRGSEGQTFVTVPVPRCCHATGPELSQLPFQEQTPHINASNITRSAPACSWRCLSSRA